MKNNMNCKICHTNETNSSSGICWECLQNWALTKNDFYISIRNGQFMLKKRGIKGWRIHKTTIKDILEEYYNLSNPTCPNCKGDRTVCDCEC